MCCCLPGSAGSQTNLLPYIDRHFLHYGNSPNTPWLHEQEFNSCKCVMMMQKVNNNIWRVCNSNVKFVYSTVTPSNSFCNINNMAVLHASSRKTPFARRESKRDAWLWVSRLTLSCVLAWNLWSGEVPSPSHPPPCLKPLLPPLSVNCVQCPACIPWCVTSYTLVMSMN